MQNYGSRLYIFSACRETVSGKDGSFFAGKTIAEFVDIMKTMDNRHVVNSDLLVTYQGNGLAMGQKRDKKHF